MSNKKIVDFKPELIKPYLSKVALEYVCALEDEVGRLREAQRMLYGVWVC
jgi:hypothetical protein